MFYSLVFFRRNTLHKEKDHLVNDYEQNMKLLQSKYGADINLLKKEHALSASKVLYMLADTAMQSSYLLIQYMATDSHVEANYLAFAISLYFILKITETSRIFSGI